MNKAVFISDIHSNKPALDAVLKDAEKHGPFDAKYCLGDIVGYGPKPNEVIDRIREEGFTCVLGNHDYAVREGNFNRMTMDAKLVAIKNRELMTKDSLHFLRRIKPEPKYKPPVALVHGSYHPHKNDRFENIYIDEVTAASLAIQAVKEKFPRAKVAAFGYTHIPAFAYFSNGSLIFEQLTYGREGRPSYKVIISKASHPILFNPGSVSRPRNGSPRACYAIISITNAVVIDFRTVKYNYRATQKAMRPLNMPSFLVSRLSEVF